MKDRRTWLETLLLATSGYRGARLVRDFFRDGNPTTLVRAETRYGPVFALDPAAIMDAIILRDGCYEPELLKLISDSIPHGGVFWDVGANIGVHSITCKYLRPDVTVVAFEPVPFVLARLILNAEMNDSDVKIMPVALGDKSGYAKMSIKIRGNTGISSLSPWPGSKYDGELVVRVETGDELVASKTIPPPSVVKIDVEGFERNVLLGLGKMLASDMVETILFESGPDEKLVGVAAILEARKFVITPVGTSSTNKPVNYIARRMKS